MLPYSRAFTLYELLITLALAAVLVSLAIPSFAGIAARARQAVEINALFHAFHQARKESIMRRKVVSLCPSRDGATCRPDTDWSAGWIMFHGQTDAPMVIASDSPILAHRVDDSIRISSNRRVFTSRATMKRATNGTLIVCDRRQRVPAKALVVSYTGRPRVAFERSDGGTYSCAD